jgi:hypothetical protein
LRTVELVGPSDCGLHVARDGSAPDARVVAVTVQVDTPTPAEC